MTSNITIQRIANVLLSRLKFIIVATIISTLLFFTYTKLFIAPMYSTSAMIYVQNYSNDKGTANSENKKIYNSDISGSANLANICVTLFKNSDDLTSLYNGCSVDLSVEPDTFFITISVQGSDPQKCALVANQIAEKAGDVFKARFQYGQLGSIRKAQVPQSPYYPNYMNNTLIGFVVGLAVSCIISILIEMIDTTIKSDDDMQSLYGIPVFAEIPDFESQG